MINILDQIDYDSFVRNQRQFYCSHVKKLKSKQLKKFNKILVRQKPAMQNVGINNKWIMNLSNVNIPREVQHILSLGDKFNLPYGNNEFPMKDLIIDVEYILDKFDDDIKILIRNNCINIITNFVRKKRPLDNKKKQLINMSKQTSNFLKNNKDNILILKADKGNTTVIMNKSDYLETSNNMLNDEFTYKKLNKDPTITIQNKNNKLIDSLIKEGYIVNEQGKKLKTNNATPPKIYFQPKIHKNNKSLRPIVSFVGSPLYGLTDFLANILNGLFVRDEIYVRNSFEFVESISNIEIPRGYQIISLDVISLFTNIPTNVVIDIVDRKWHLIEDKVKIPLQRFTELLTFVFDNSYFQYQEDFYKQTYGLGMGNCLSPICSDLVMQDLQENCIKNLPFQLPFYKRYVDDIITSIPEDQEVTILNVFNSYHPRIQFTIEKENHNTIAFLDVLLIRNEKGIETDWYHKPSFSERFLNYTSEHPLQQKINIINNLKTRALSLSSERFHKKNLKYIEELLLKNNYPLSLIKKVLNRANAQRIMKQNDTTIFCKIPYIEKLSEQIKSTFKGHVTKKEEQVKITLKSENTIKKKFFSKTKSKTKKELKSNVVYDIPCLQCNRSYVGQTGRYLKQRLKEHQNDQKNYLLKANPTALVEHKLETGHGFDFDNAKILQTQVNYKKRLTAEMIEIQRKNKNCVNKRTDIQHLSSAYFNILSTK